MSNETQLRGTCPAPFFDLSQFPQNSGYAKGRICAELPGKDMSCCLPCPAADWIYPENFYMMTRIPGFIALGSIGFCAFLLLAFIVLPVETTKRHYLNTCLLISIILLELGFAIPVLVKPQQCENAITPRDMSDSWTCAWSGAFIVAGGCAANMWILMRVMSMHLQICWDIIPNRTFFWTSQIAAWGCTAAVTTVCLYITGVSFRFGDYCHVNNYKGLQTLWGPLLGFAGLSLTLQASTFIYCLKVYLQNLFEDRPITGNSNPLSLPNSNRGRTAKAVYRRVKRVLSLQWRSLLISALVVVDVVYLSVVFVVLNARIEGVIEDVQQVLPWVYCIILSKDRDKCMPYAQPLRPRDSILVATLVLLSIVGIQASLLICKWDIFRGWWVLLTTLHKKNKSEFVDLDSPNDPLTRHMALGYPASGQDRKIQMVKVGSPATTTIEMSPSTTFTSPSDDYKSPILYKSRSTSYPSSTTELTPALVSTNPPSVFATSPILERDPQADFAEAHYWQNQDMEMGLAQARLARNRSLERHYRPSSFSFSSPRPPSAGRRPSRNDTAPAPVVVRPTTAERGLGMSWDAFETWGDAIPRAR